jgi:hypothetical protein
VCLLSWVVVERLPEPGSAAGPRFLGLRRGEDAHERKGLRQP